MLWLALTVGGVGVLFGFWLFRVHLIIAGSIALALLCVPAAVVAQWTPLESIGYMLILIGTLQSGYLAGVLLLYMSSRARRAAANPAEPHQPTIPG